MPRTIPTSSTLLLLTTATACGGDPALGVWNGTFLDAGYDGVELPFVDDEVTRAGMPYTSTLTTSMTLADPIGNLRFVERYVDSEGVEVEAYIDSYMLSTIRQRQGVWMVSAPDFDQLVLTCTEDSDILDCVGQDVEQLDYTLRFEPAED